MKRLSVVLEVVIAALGVLALVAMGGGWTMGVAMLCIAGAIGVVVNRRDITPPLNGNDNGNVNDNDNVNGNDTGAGDQ
jgi:hypothetical protein